MWTSSWRHFRFYIGLPKSFLWARCHIKNTVICFTIFSYFLVLKCHCVYFFNIIVLCEKTVLHRFLYHVIKPHATYQLFCFWFISCKKKNKQSTDGNQNRSFFCGHAYKSSFAHSWTLTPVTFLILFFILLSISFDFLGTYFKKSVSALFREVKILSFT